MKLPVKIAFIGLSTILNNIVLKHQEYFQDELIVLLEYLIKQVLLEKKTSNYSNKGC
jgi:hypothetical protein